MLTPENHDDSLIHNTPLLGTVIPNRIFVGGIDYKVRAAKFAQAQCMFGRVSYCGRVDTREQQSMIASYGQSLWVYESVKWELT